jgi:hypothetical protein
LDDSWCCKRIRSQDQDQQNNRTEVSHGMKTPFAKELTLNSGKRLSNRSTFTINSKSRFLGKFQPRKAKFQRFSKASLSSCAALCTGLPAGCHFGLRVRRLARSGML